jgi:membrane protease YdiL (CAAX protease family)
VLKRLLKAASIGLLLVGLGLIAYFVLAGSYVDESGFLVEEFAAWALGILLVILSLIGFLIMWVGKLINRKKFSSN